MAPMLKRLAYLNLGVNQYYLLLNRPWKVVLKSGTNDGGNISYTIPPSPRTALSITDIVGSGTGVLEIAQGTGAEREVVLSVAVDGTFHFRPKISWNLTLDLPVTISFTSSDQNTTTYLNLYGFQVAL